MQSTTAGGLLNVKSLFSTSLPSPPSPILTGQMLLACTVGSQHGQGVQYWAMGADGTRKATERRSEVNDKPV